VLLANLAAHALAGDVTTAPPVAIIGLWIGLVFWTATFGLITDRLAAGLLRVAVPAPGHRLTRANAQTTTASHDEGDDAPSTATTTAGDRVTTPPPVGTGALTARQLQVVTLLADGLRYREIAACLSISERQVQRHVGDAIRRLDVSSVGELVAVALAEGLIFMDGSVA
jgi:DNA-binding CsgD family transcriptional regulator